MRDFELKFAIFKFVFVASSLHVKITLKKRRIVLVLNMNW